MIDKRTVFILGAGASCPYGYQSGANLRTWICLQGGFRDNYIPYKFSRSCNEFINQFSKSSRQSIDIFIAANPKLAPIGKYIIAFSIFKSEERSRFREEAQLEREFYSKSSYGGPSNRFLARKYFQGDDWYLYLFNRLTSGLTKPDVLPDFSGDKISFIMFNYDRSLEYFLYESLSSSFTEVPEPEINKYLKNLKILHIYGQIAPLKWQNPEQGVNYRPQIDETLLQKSANNIKTIFEQRASPELDEAKKLLMQAEQIFFLGFGYALENMAILELPGIISNRCRVYGTGFNLIEEEIERIRSAIQEGRKARNSIVAITKIESGHIDCLMLLRKYLN